MTVIDNSIVISWFVEEVGRELALSVKKRLLSMPNPRLLVPSLWILEFTNTLLFLERRRKISREFRLDCLEDIQILPFTIAPPPSLRTAHIIEDLAFRHHLSAYDAEYLRIAKDAKVPLASTDKPLLQAVEKEGVEIFDPES